MCVCVHTRVPKWKVTDWLPRPRRFSMNDKEFNTRWNLKSHSESCCWPHRLALTTFRLWSSEGCLGVDTCNVSPVGIRLITNVCLPVSIPWGAMKENKWKQTYTVISNTCWSRTGQIPQILCLNVDLFYFSHLLFLSFLKKYNKYKWKVCDLKVIGALCFYWLLFIFFFFRLNIPKGTLIPLTKRDQMKLDSILKRPYVACQPFWRKEVWFFLKFKCYVFYCLFLQEWLFI